MAEKIHNWKQIKTDARAAARKNGHSPDNFHKMSHMLWTANCRCGAGLVVTFDMRTSAPRVEGEMITDKCPKVDGSIYRASMSELFADKVEPVDAEKFLSAMEAMSVLSEYWKETDAHFVEAVIAVKKGLGCSPRYATERVELMEKLFNFKLRR